MKNERAFVALEAMCLIVVGLLACAILCVAVGSSRSSDRAATAARNMRACGVAIFQMAEDEGTFGPAYVFGSDATSVDWNIADQSDFNPGFNGYVHWSGVALAGGYAATEEVFSSPDAPRGGAPRTNPGSNALDWEVGQANAFGAAAPAATPSDRQARRLAFAVNHAIMPRNKLSASGSLRWNRLVESGEVEFGARPQLGGLGVGGAGSAVYAGAVSGVDGSAIADPARTILMAEWAFSPSLGWRALATNNGGGDFYKSHRPVTPFVGVSSGTNIYAEPNSATLARFRYPTIAEIQPLGPDMLGTSTELNAVGRHRAGGTSLFGTLDGAVVQMTVEQTIVGRMWGDRFHSITGNNAVMP